MDSTILLFLTQDGVLNGAVYSLMAVAFVLLFAVTRIIFIPQGDFLAYSGLTLAFLQKGQVPGTIWLLVGLGVLAGISVLLHERKTQNTAERIKTIFWYWVVPSMIALITWSLAGPDLSGAAALILTMFLVVPMGPYIYQLCFRPIAQSSVLVLLIASVGVHWLMIGLGLVFFTAEGQRNAPLWDADFTFGPLFVSGQTLLVIGAAVVLLIALYVFFSRTMQGKSLIAAAVSPRGAGLVGISTTDAGVKAFLMAAFIGALAGVLMSSVSTVYYDSGFMIGLKGFIASIIGGFTSYPLALLGALFIGLSEAFSAFWASAYKEVIVFGLIIPVLLWRSILAGDHEEH